MSLFHLVSGMTEGAGQYVQQQREIARQQEDQELNARLEMLKSLASSPHFNSEQYGALLHETLDLASQKGPNRKLKGGTQGFLGRHQDLPISQLIAGAATGDPSKPFKTSGQTLDQVPAVGVGQSDVNSLPDISALAGLGGGKSGPQQAPSTDSSGGAPTTGGGGMTPPPSSPAAASKGGPSMPGGAPSGPTSVAAGAAPAAGAAAGAPAPAGPQPVPESSLPKPPGTSTMLSAGNAMVQESQNPVPAVPAARAASAPGAQLRQPPPPIFSPTDIGPKGTLLTPDQESMMAANAKGREAYGAQAGAMQGKLASLDEILPNDYTLGPEDQAAREQLKSQVRAHLLGLSVGRQLQRWVQDPNNPEQELEMRWDSMSGKEVPTGNSRTNTRAFSGFSRSTNPQGDVVVMRGGKVVNTVPGAGRKQFEPPPINVGESVDAQGNTTRTYVGRSVVGGGGAGAGMKPPPGGAGKPAGAGGPAGESSTGTSVRRTPGGGMEVSRAPVAKFSDQQKTALAGINSSEQFAKDALAFLQENHLENDNNPLSSQWDAFLYRHHMDPGQAEELIQNVGIAEPKAIIGQMGGQRGQYWGQMLQQHTAQPMDTHALMFKKLNNMLGIGEQIKKDINDSAMMVPTPGGPRIPSRRGGQQPGGLTPPPGGGPGGPSAGKTVTLQQLQAVAAKRGTTVEQERQRATAEGYQLVR